MVVFWISDQWELEEYVLELLPLDGDHSGAACGKAIYEALNTRKIATKLRELLVLVYI